MHSWTIRSLLLGLGVLVAAAIAVMFYGWQNTLPKGMKVSGWEVGGWEADHFQKGFDERIALLHHKKVSMTARLISSGETVRSATLGEMGLTTNAEPLAAEIGRMFQGPVWERAAARWQSRNRAFDLTLALDEKKLAETSKRLWPELYESRPVNAVRKITADDRVQYVAEVPAVRLDEKTLFQTVTSQLDQELGTLLAEAPLAVAVPTFELQPEVTVASLKAQGIERVIASYTTSFATSGAGRKHNVKSTASTIHDMLLAPGAVFDYAAVIKETEQAFGFREAPVILNGKLVPGIGGGICQVSTTLYNAVLRAGLDIVERRNHSLPISYAPLGQDATFASGYINFKFRNSTGKHLLIRTATEGNKLTVKLFGTLDPNVTYDIKSVTVQEIEPPKKYVKNPTLPKGAVELLQRGKKGYVVETYRYKKVSGKTVDQERISKDTYKAQPALYASNSGDPAKGGGSRSPAREPGPIIEDGVMAPLFE